MSTTTRPAGRRTRMLLVGALSATLFAGTLGTATASAATGGTDRPLKGEASGTMLIDPNTGTFTIDGHGKATHLGRFQFHTDGQCFSPSCDIFTYTTTYTAANGDTVTASLATSSADSGRFTNVETVTGGTGRFAGASGTATFTGTASGTSEPFTLHITDTFRGTISY